MTADSPEARTRTICLEPAGQGVIELKTFYTFEGHEFPIWFDPEFGLMACLDDLCEIHKCAPAEVLPLLYCDDDLIKNINPNDTLVNLDGEEAMEVMRRLSTNRPRAIRFRKWLIDEFHPYH
jgi:hypothetical protein